MNTYFRDKEGFVLFIFVIIKSYNTYAYIYVFKANKRTIFNTKILENFSHWLTNSLNFKASAPANSQGETRKETLFTFSLSDTSI